MEGGYRPISWVVPWMAIELERRWEVLRWSVECSIDPRITHEPNSMQRLLSLQSSVVKGVVVDEG